MATLIIAEKASQARDLRAALGARFGQILAAEGHLLRLAEPEEVNSAAAFDAAFNGPALIAAQVDSHGLPAELP
ncbi:MAG: toprim domain-containing protein [Beijerinckiaceae bacterium]